MRSCFLFVLLILTGRVYAQSPAAADSVVCHVMEYFDEDSLNQKEQYTIVYNQRGQIISETYFKFQETCLMYHIGYSLRYTYSDSLLTEKILTEKQKNPVKYKYTYNDKGKLVTESKFKWVQDATSPAYHRPGMPAEGNSTGGSWSQVSYATISYDMKGRKISWDATRLHDENENLEKWEYDDQNRVTSHQIFAHGKLAHKTDYTYYEGGYRYWQIDYTHDGDLAIEQEQGDGYTSMIIHVIKLDKNGRVQSEKLTSEKGADQCIISFYYDKQGRLSKSVTYDYLSGGLITYVYKRPK